MKLVAGFYRECGGSGRVGRARIKGWRVAGFSCLSGVFVCFARVQALAGLVAGAEEIATGA